MIRDRRLLSSCLAADVTPWRFAASMPTMPHYYTLRRNWTYPTMFDWCVNSIQRLGFDRTFKGRTYRYFYGECWVYWTMESSDGTCIILNRARPDGIAIESRKSRIGTGLFSLTGIYAGQLFCDLSGKSVDFDDPIWDGPGGLEETSYAIQIGERTWIKSDGIEKYANHSCEPNTAVVYSDKVMYMALRDIVVGDEITWDYDTTERPKIWKMECRCGTPSCRGVIGTRTMKSIPPWSQPWSGWRSK